VGHRTDKPGKVPQSAASHPKDPMTDFDLTLTRPLIFLPGLVAAAAVVALAAFVMIPAPPAVAAPGPLPVAKAAATRDRSCDTCGVMQTIRRTDPRTGEAVYEFSVRMRDGSTRDSTGSTRGGWVEGDRVMLIGGAAARALEEKQNVAL
jgi:hypothetical protein